MWECSVIEEDVPTNGKCRYAPNEDLQVGVSVCKFAVTSGSVFAHS